VGIVSAISIDQTLVGYGEVLGALLALLLLAHVFVATETKRFGRRDRRASCAPGRRTAR
jgi:hypothetical protein